MTDEIVVVGAGPYGCSVGAHLRGRGAAVRVLGEPMGSWTQNMPAGMFLKSSPSASSFASPGAGVTIDDYCRTHGLSPFDEHRDAVPIETFVDYGRWYADHHELDVDKRIVERVARSGRGFDVALSDGETLRTKCVVVASGHVAHAYTPPELAALSPGGPAPDRAVSHASQHADLSRYAGRRVAVVGAGQSALESAALLHEAGADVVVLVRGPGILWGGPDTGEESLRSRLRAPRSGLGPGWRHRALTDLPFLVRRLPPSARTYLLENILGPFGSWWLRDRVDGQVEIRIGSRITRAVAGDDGRVRLELSEADGGVAKLDVDHVIAGTGYRVDVGSIPFLDRRLAQALRTVRGTASPELSAASESSAPGLYFTGLASAMTFGPVMRFVYGTHFAAPRIAAAALKSATT